MGPPQQRTAILIDQGRTRGDILVALPAETVGEAVNRYDFAKLATRDVTRPFDEIEPTRMCFGRGLCTYPAYDLVGIGQEGEDRSAAPRCGSPVGARTYRPSDASLVAVITSECEGPMTKALATRSPVASKRLQTHATSL